MTTLDIVNGINKVSQWQQQANQELKAYERSKSAQSLEKIILIQQGIIAILIGLLKGIIAILIGLVQGKPGTSSTSLDSFARTSVQQIESQILQVQLNGKQSKFLAGQVLSCKWNIPDMDSDSSGM